MLIVFLDFRRAFETIKYKFDIAGVRRDVLDWFKSYLHEQYTKRLHIKKCVLAPSAVSCISVSQGTVVGPSLFLVYLLLIYNGLSIVT